VIDVSINQDLNDLLRWWPPIWQKVFACRLEPQSTAAGCERRRGLGLKWKDKSGRDWVGGLYKPPIIHRENAIPRIQTHGFAEHEFRPSGAFPTAFAAQELAAAGFGTASQ